MARTNKKQRVAKVAFVAHSQPIIPPFTPIHAQVTQPTTKPEPLEKWGRLKTLSKLAAFRQNKLDKTEIAPLFQNLIDYNVVHTLKAWEQNVATRLVREGICKL